MRPLIAKVEERQVLMGNAWEDMMEMALRQASVFGGYQFGDVPINTVWTPAAVRDEKKEIEVATAKKALGRADRTDLVRAGLRCRADRRHARIARSAGQGCQSEHGRSDGSTGRHRAVAATVKCH